jgi:hypothetical protein
VARQFVKRDTSHVLAAAEQWIRTCLIEDHSILLSEPRWTTSYVTVLIEAFVERPDPGDDDFMTKLKGQMKGASPPVQQLMAEMLWALLLFPSNMKPRTKYQQVREVWALSGQQLPGNHPLLDDKVLAGIGSGGPGFNTYRPNELGYLICLARDLKQRDKSEREEILTDYDMFMDWIESVPRKGSRQFRHMLRFFAFPDRVERISSNNDRRIILTAFGCGSPREVAEWNDRELDDRLMELRARLQNAQPSAVLDFYETPLKERWSRDRTIRTVEGEVSVTVPSEDDDVEEKDAIVPEAKAHEARQSIKIQSKLARIGAVMGFKVWIPRGDRARVSELLAARENAAFIQDLPLNYDNATLDTIEQIDVLWLKGRSIARAFEVEHTTAVYSGLIRMADLQALQPNMDIRLHIVAPDERRDKVFHEMKRPVFSLLDRGPLSRSCTFISYESVDAINCLEHLAHTNDSIIADYEERAE